MILYNRLSKADGLSSEQRITLKLMLMRIAMAVGDQKNLEYYSNEISASACDNQILHKYVAQSLGCFVVRFRNFLLFKLLNLIL